MKTNIINYINLLTNEVSNIIKTSTYENREEKFKENGYKVCDRRSYSDICVKKNNLEFVVYYYSGSCSYEIGNGVYYRGIYYNTNQYEKLAEILIMSEWECDYERDIFATQLIETIVKEINETKSIVNGRGLGEIGSALRYRGYFVSYDGFSVCNFSKNGILYTATNRDRSWSVTDNFKVYLDDNTISKEFTLYNSNRTKLDRDFERIFGKVRKLGKRTTEKDLLSTYKRFRVRTYGSKTLNTIAYYDNFEDAKNFAKEESIKRAKETPRDLQRFAFTNPIDISDDYDLLAGYKYYQCGNSEFLVYVMGER